MRKQTAQWPDYYGDLSVQVYAPRFYYSLTQKKDDYSKKVVFGKNQDYSIAELIPAVEQGVRVTITGATKGLSIYRALTDQSVLGTEIEKA